MENDPYIAHQPVLKKILILVLSSTGHEWYRECTKKQKETWDSIEVEGVDTLFYYGNPNFPFTTTFGKDLIVNTGDGWFDLSNKFFKALTYSYNLEWDFIFKTNASTYVDKQRLLNFAQTLPTQNCYSGIIGKENGYNFASGAGTFLSRDCVKILIDNFEDQYLQMVDDIATCRILHKFNVLADESNVRRVDYDHKKNFNELIKSVEFTDVYPFQYRCKSDNFDRNKDLIAFENIFNYLKSNNFKK